MDQYHTLDSKNPQRYISHIPLTTAGQSGKYYL